MRKRTRQSTVVVSPVSVVRRETWTYDKHTAPRAVAVIAHREADGRFAGGRFGNGARA